MTEREREALLDFCKIEFQATYCKISLARIPEPPARRVPLMPAKREWAAIGFSGFKEALPVEDGEEHRWISQIIGQRSDGQLFTVFVTLPIDFEEPASWVMLRLAEGMDKLQKFRDCACPSPCESHPRITEPETSSLVS